MRYAAGIGIAAARSSFLLLGVVTQAACSSASPRELVPLPDEDFAVAFYEIVRSTGEHEERSPIFQISREDQQIGPEPRDLELEQGDFVLVIGFEQGELLAVDAAVDLSDLGRVEILDRSESCEQARTDAERHRMLVPCASRARVLSWKPGDQGFSELTREQDLEFLEGCTLALPLRATGCVPYGSDALRSFHPDGAALQITQAVRDGLRLDGDRIFIASWRALELFNRNAQEPEKPVARIAAPEIESTRIITAADVLEEEGTGRRVVIASAEDPQRRSVRVTTLIQAEIEEDSLRFVATATTFPDPISDLAFDRKGRIIAVSPNGAVWLAPEPSGPWARSMPLGQENLDIVQATDDPARPHLLAASNSGLVFLGDLFRETPLERSNASTTMSAITTFFDGSALHYWGYSRSQAALEPPQLFYRLPGQQWQRQEIFVPTLGTPCSEELECGRRKLYETFHDIAIAPGGPGEDYTVIAIPEACTSLMTFRKSDRCPGMLPAGQIEVSKQTLFVRIHVLEDAFVTLFGNRGEVYEVEIAP